MAQAMQQSTPFSAPVEKFSLLRSRVLTGALLDDVKTLETSILRFGLLSPLVAAHQKGRLVIVDGKKRFAALRRLAFQGRLPAALKNIPYILVSPDTAEQTAEASALVRSETLLRSVSQRAQAGDHSRTIAKSLGLSSQCVRNLICLSRVAPAIRRAFTEREVPFDVAKAYSAIPSRTQQLVLFHRLGHGATASDVLAAASVDERLAHVA